MNAPYVEQYTPMVYVVLHAPLRVEGMQRATDCKIRLAIAHDWDDEMKDLKLAERVAKYLSKHCIAVSIDATKIRNSDRMYIEDLYPLTVRAQ